VVLAPWDDMRDLRFGSLGEIFALDNLCQQQDAVMSGGITMATMNVSLPDSMKLWVEQQAKTGKYSNSSDYVRDLIRKDQEKAQKIASLQARVDEGLRSGRSSSDMRAIKKRAL
jgi:antitoxin ParD1/3/4|tara:strand:+ start:745 stop:1086 length:342 start_codon:yes stop_codon:yes gene_type:complete